MINQTYCSLPEFPYYVYSLWDEHTCVYIGVSKNPSAREKAHKGDKKQFKEMLLLCSFTDEKTALLYEANLIVRVRPKYNKQNPNPEPVDTDAIFDTLRLRQFAITNGVEFEKYDLVRESIVRNRIEEEEWKRWNELYV